MGRARIAAGLVFACLVLPSCGGGGGSSPTAPTPMAGSLAGTWRGDISGSAAAGAFTCALEVRLEADDQEPGVFFGSWSAECPGAEVGGFAVAFDVAGFILLSGASFSPEQAPHPLGTCGWGAPVALRGNELSGTWQPPDDCEDPSLVGGPVRLRFVG